MSEIIPHSPVDLASIALPLPEANVIIRPGTMSDLLFLDSLQKMHTKMVGWMPTKTLEGKIRLGHVLVAETVRDGTRPHPGPLPEGEGEKVGYLIGNDQYFKRDDVGIIYQLNVLPGKQRGFIGASLLKAQFDRSAYGCKLYCCWCAQDIAANHFWEAMGFVPLAFRAGSEKKSRVHIFWQKRIRAGDTGDVTRGGTPWWFPSKTAGGSIREDRIVLPIPPGTTWSDAKPLVLPQELSAVSGQLSVENAKPQARGKRVKTVEPPKVVRRNGLMFDIPAQGEPLPGTKPAKPAKVKSAKVKRVCDPRLVSAARELRDRWLEKVNDEPMLLASVGKYSISRAIEDRAERGDRSRIALPMPEAA